MVLETTIVTLVSSWLLLAASSMEHLLCPKAAFMNGITRSTSDILVYSSWSCLSRTISISTGVGKSFVLRITIPLRELSLIKRKKTIKKVGCIEAKTSVSIYAIEIASYLETKEGEDLYREAFDLELSNKVWNHRAKAVDKKTRKVIKLKKAQKLNHKEHESIASSSFNSRHLKPKIVIKRPLKVEEIPSQKAQRTIRSKNTIAATLDSTATSSSEAANLFSEHSFTSNDSDETYQQVEEREVQEDKLRTKTFYYLSMHEIHHSDSIKESDIKFFYDDMTFEERADHSNIEIITANKSQLQPVSFSRQF